MSVSALAIIRDTFISLPGGNYSKGDWKTLALCVFLLPAWYATLDMPKSLLDTFSPGYIYAPTIHESSRISFSQSIDQFAQVLHTFLCSDSTIFFHAITYQITFNTSWVHEHKGHLWHVNAETLDDGFLGCFGCTLGIAATGGVVPNGTHSRSHDNDFGGPTGTYFGQDGAKKKECSNGVHGESILHCVSCYSIH